MGKMPMPRFTQMVSVATLASCSLVETSAVTNASTAVFRLIDCLRRGQAEFPTGGANDKLVWVLVLLFT